MEPKFWLASARPLAGQAPTAKRKEWNRSLLRGEPTALAMEQPVCGPRLFSCLRETMPASCFPACLLIFQPSTSLILPTRTRGASCSGGSQCGLAVVKRISVSPRRERPKVGPQVPPRGGHGARRKESWRCGMLGRSLGWVGFGPSMRAWTSLR